MSMENGDLVGVYYLMQSIKFSYPPLEIDSHPFSHILILDGAVYQSQLKPRATLLSLYVSLGIVLDDSELNHHNNHLLTAK